MIAEHELIRTEEKFARMQGIPVEDLSKEKEVVANDTHVTSDIFKCKLKQWRLMFYLDFMRELPLRKILNSYKPKNRLYIQLNCGNNITKFPLEYDHLLRKQKVDISENGSRFDTPRFRKIIERRNKSEIKLKPKLSFVDELRKSYKLKVFRNTATRFKSMDKSRSKDNQLESIDENEDRLVDLKCNKLRIHYFFTENYNIENFINETVVEFRLTDGEEWKDIIANGKLALHLVHKDLKNNPTYQFDREELEIVRMETINVFMFCLSSDIGTFYLKTKVGYKFDQEIQTENLDLWRYNSVYFPEN